jgi:hypothetical protein
MTQADRLRVELVRKLADYLDGIDVSNHQQGDIIDLPRHDARMLIAEGWALPFYEATRVVRTYGTLLDSAVATDPIERRTVEQLRRFREQLESNRFDQQERRRAEDRIREELQDARATTLNGRTVDC